MAAFHNHPRHSAFIWLDGHPDLGRVGFYRSHNVIWLLDHKVCNVRNKGAQLIMPIGPSLFEAV
jgi:hypothetical protein